VTALGITFSRILFQAHSIQYCNRTTAVAN
jgi:hypothetical protein